MVIEQGRESQGRESHGRHSHGRDSHGRDSLGRAHGGLRHALLRRDFLRHRDAHLYERMDDPDCDPRMLRRTYSGFRVLNPLVSRWPSTYRRLIRPLLSPTEERTLLDVGSGGGDIARSLARWAAHDGLRLRVTGIDPDLRAHAHASSLPPLPGVTFRQARLEDVQEDYDLVVSNHVLHHVDDVRAFLDLSAQRARVMTVHSDLVRSRAAFAAFGIASAPFFPGSFIRDDGLTSLRRSFTVPELREIAPAGWRVIEQPPSRLLAVKVASA